MWLFLSCFGLFLLLVGGLYAFRDKEVNEDNLPLRYRRSKYYD